MFQMSNGGSSGRYQTQCIPLGADRRRGMPRESGGGCSSKKTPGPTDVTAALARAVTLSYSPSPHLDHVGVARACRRTHDDVCRRGDTPRSVFAPSTRRWRRSTRRRQTVRCQLRRSPPPRRSAHIAQVFSAQGLRPATDAGRLERHNCLLVRPCAKSNVRARFRATSKCRAGVHGSRNARTLPFPPSCDSEHEAHALASRSVATRYRPSAARLNSCSRRRRAGQTRAAAAQPLDRARSADPKVLPAPDLVHEASQPRRASVRSPACRANPTRGRALPARPPRAQPVAPGSSRPTRVEQPPVAQHASA